MFVQVVRVGVLAALAVALTAGPAEAFGKRRSSCSEPTYPCYTPCYPIYCPPCPKPVGWDCVRNMTNVCLKITITSCCGTQSATVPPGSCFYFSWDMSVPAPTLVVTAYSVPGCQLVATFPFTPLNFPPPFCCDKDNCLQIFTAGAGIQTTSTRTAPVK